MKLLTFKDTCVIKRRNSVDEYDNIDYDTIYSGECMFQPSVVTYSIGMYDSTALVFLPLVTDALIQLDDVIVITTERAQEFEGVIDRVRDIKLNIVGNAECIRLEVKQIKQNG